MKNYEGLAQRLGDLLEIYERLLYMDCLNYGGKAVLEVLRELQGVLEGGEPHDVDG